MEIKLFSNKYLIKSWVLDKKNRPWKCTGELFKDLLPGDYIYFVHELPQPGNGGYAPKYNIIGLRNGTIIGETRRDASTLSLQLSHFILEEI